MLDPDIVRLMMDAAGVSGDMAAILAAAEEIYDEIVPASLHDKLCPGVLDLLDRLRGKTSLALVTGNLTRIGRRKLERAGIGHYFPFGAFGEMASTRGGLARIAIDHERAEGPITLIGDAPQDVVAARENGIRSIAVRTGVTPPGELEACRPDYILDDLTHLVPDHHLE